ncbi:MAG: hypothetical protein LKG27_06310 [Clostridiaceae bacterium]|jgi:hypothetical protein|nr:hypothetical protein [Clostridiaceae bacterium]
MPKETCLIRYFESLGLEVHTGTKARGNQGFFLKNRIDISKNIKPERIAPTLIHEFAHYIHSKLEPDMNKTGGTFLKIFQTENPIIKKELVAVTHFVDKNSLCEKLYTHKKLVQEKIKFYDNEVKKYYPKFQRSKKFKEFNNYIKKSKAKYLLKYDRVKLITGFFNRHYEIYSIDNIENDFTDMPKAFASYIRLHSYQKRQSRISNKINHYKKYYEKPAELFARLVESIYIDKNSTCDIAPVTTGIFYELLNNNYYKELKNVID